MAEDLSAQLNSTPGCIPAKWSRSTIADGDWLQAKTLSPLSSRDNWLANQITQSEIDLETERRERMAADAYLSAVIDPLSSDLYSFSGKVEASAVQITNQIQAETDRATARENALEQLITNEKNRAKGAETTLQQHIDEEKTRAEVAEEALDTRVDKVENDISTLKAATDVIMVYGDYNTFTTNSGDLILTDADVIKVLSDETSGYEQVYYQWYDPNSGHEWSGWNDIGSLNPYYSKSEIDGLLTHIENNIETHVEQNYLSNDVHTGRNIITTLSESPKELTIATKDNVDFDSVSAATAYGNSAKFTEFSGTTFNGTTYNGTTFNGTTITGTNFVGTTINNSNIDTLISRTNKSYDIVNSAKFSAVGTTTSTAYISGGFGIKAGTGVGVSLEGKNVVITAEGTKYNAGDYISTANKTISVTGNLIGSAESGQSAYNWITGQSATLSAGQGIIFTSAAENTMGISVNYTTTNGYVTELNGVPLSAGDNYTQGRCITIDSQNKINLSSDINLNEKLVIDHYNESDSETYATANLESYKLDFSGSRDSNGSFRGHSATYNINQLMIDNYYDENNLSFVKLDNEKLQLSATYKNGGFTVSSYTNLATEYFETQKAGISSPYYLKFDGYRVSAGNNTSTVAAAQWHDIILKANGTWVSATSQEIVIDAPYQTRIVVTASVPGSFSANTYYII